MDREERQKHLIVMFKDLIELLEEHDLENLVILIIENHMEQLLSVKEIVLNTQKAETFIQKVIREEGKE